MYLAARAARNSKYLSCNWISQRHTTTTTALVSFIKFSKHSAIIEVKVYKYAGTWTIKAISWWCWADRELPPTDSKTWPPPPSHTKFHAARYPIRGKGHRIPQQLQNVIWDFLALMIALIRFSLLPINISKRKRAQNRWTICTCCNLINKGKNSKHQQQCKTVLTAQY